jgi:hypothetical protein
MIFGPFSVLIDESVFKRAASTDIDTLPSNALPEET